MKLTPFITVKQMFLHFLLELHVFVFLSVSCCNEVSKRHRLWLFLVISCAKRVYDMGLIALCPGGGAGTLQYNSYSKTPNPLRPLSQLPWQGGPFFKKDPPPGFPLKSYLVSSDRIYDTGPWLKLAICYRISFQRGLDCLSIRYWQASTY